MGLFNGGGGTLKVNSSSNPMPNTDGTSSPSYSSPWNVGDPNEPTGWVGFFGVVSVAVVLFVLIPTLL